MVLRAALQRQEKDIEIVAINDLDKPSTLAHLFKYDSVHRNWPGTVSSNENSITIDGKVYKVTAEKDPAKLPWKELGVDVVLECTGRFLTKDKAGLHLQAGAKKVVISAPAKEPVDLTMCFGINHTSYDASKHHIISNASCTTNCLAPVVKVVMESFGFRHGFMTTVHAYTNDQNILDLPHKDLRRARAAAMSMIPTTTGAAKATGLVIPAVKGKIDGIAIRVPTPDVSVVDLVAEVEKDATIDEVNAAFRAAAAGPMNGILGASDEPLVSVDYTGDPRSSIVDLKSTNVVGGRLVKVMAWYDNEWGYSQRVVDLVRYVGERFS